MPHGCPPYNGWEHALGDIALPPVIVALLDACVLYPPVLRETLLQIAAAGHYRPVWSERIVAEVVRHQGAHGRLSADGIPALQERLATAFPEACIPVEADLIATMANQAKDRHVLAAAVAARAACLVTANLKDFPPPALEPHGITAQHPAAFLSDLYQRDPQGILDVLSRQAATWQPGVPLGTLLDWLQTTAPRFARTVRAGIRP